MTDVSIIIVNYHSAQMVIDCVESVESHTRGLDYELFIVDNESTEQEREAFRHVLGDRVLVIPSESNLGFGKANNLGAASAAGKYLFLLNPDTILMNNAVKALFDYLELHPEAGAAGGNLFAPDRTPTGSFCQSFDCPEQEKDPSRWSTILKKKVRQKRGSADGRPFASSFNYSGRPMKVAYIYGADMMLPRALFEELGGFDPDFFMYAEEEELSWRITQKGYEIISVPDAEIIHLEGATMKSGAVFHEPQFRMRMNGKLLFFKKCYGIDGMKTFYQYRRRLYERLIRFAVLRGRKPGSTLASQMLNCLNEEYQKMTASKADRKVYHGGDQ